MRYVRSKLTGEVRKQYMWFNGQDYFFLGINEYWEVVE